MSITATVKATTFDTSTQPHIVVKMAEGFDQLEALAKSETERSERAESLAVKAMAHAVAAQATIAELEAREATRENDLASVVMRHLAPAVREGKSR